MTKQAQLFITCILDTLYPDIGRSVVRVLEKAGVTVEFPSGQTCCGQPAYNAGLRELARPIAEHTIRVFEATQGPIVIPSGSCTAMIRHGYLELFAGDPEWLLRAKNLAERTFEFSEFIVDYLGITDLGARCNGKIGYHTSCHLLRELGIDQQPRALISRVQDLEFVELPFSQDCCGFGGVFSAEHPQISSAMLKRKIENIQASGADRIVSCDAGCMTHINGGLRRLGETARVIHIAELLDAHNGNADGRLSSLGKDI